jgi:hypothetical protein
MVEAGELLGGIVRSNSPRSTSSHHHTILFSATAIRFYSQQLRVQSGAEQALQNRALTVSAERLGREHLRISSDLVA